MPLQRAGEEDPYHRRKSLQLGSPPGEPDRPGPVDSNRPTKQHQLVGAQSHPSGSPPLQGHGDRSSHPSPDRQRTAKAHVNRQAGTHSRRGPATGELGRETPAIHQSRTHLWDRKPSGRLVQQGDDRQWEVATPSLNLPSDLREVRTSDGGPLRDPTERPAAGIRVEVSDQGSHGHGRPSMQMATRSSLPLSPPSPHSRGPEEGGGRGSRGNNGGSLLASPPLAGRPRGSVHGSSLEDPSGGGGPAPGVSGASGSGVASSDRLAIEREQLREAQYSESVIRTVEASRRQSTTRIYNASWVAFADWCRAKDLRPAAASVPQVLDFLQEGHEKGLATSTLRRQVSALSTVLGGGECSPLSQHPVLKRFLKGAANLKPSVVHRFPT
ncbi:uncharacterized protein LOC116512171 [Thamnophis elegans]|uniref:uncharacterized protein LOC116512171 n=1 Tax=Thamnophis elegans TaxID=35005 RepID=UPI001379033C|nr:uncharacterized protein LOC116512171 [Thamnophis elegans]